MRFSAAVQTTDLMTAQPPSGYDPEVRRNLAIEMFRRSMFGGVIHVAFLPVICIGLGFTAERPTIGWSLLAVSVASAVIRGILARAAYAQREAPSRIFRWQVAVRGIILWQAALWSSLIYIMLDHWGPTQPGFLALSCAIGWAVASPSILAPDAPLSRMVGLVNVLPLLIWSTRPDHAVGQAGIVLSMLLYALIWLLTSLQHQYLKGMVEARLELEGAQRDLRAAKNTAEAAAAAKGQFLANMSHEIRTPLNGVIGLSEILYQRSLSQADREITSDLLRSGQHLLAIVNDILDLSKLTASKMTAERVPTVLRQLMRDSLAPFEQLTTAKGLRLSVEIEDSLPSAILTDPVRLRQILTNLVSNAVKFTRDGEIEVAAHSRRGAEPGSSAIVFSIRDTGIGIPPDRLEYIFEEFSQAEASTSRRFGGTGLGLAISRRLAELMGGSLTVSSSPGQGSHFELLLPLEAAPSVEAHPAAANPVPGVPLALKAIPLPKDFRILIVDDNIVNLRISTHLLRQTGAVVESASSAEAGIAMHCARHFDLLLLDCHMPDIDGWDATRAIRALPDPEASGVPIFALTADVFPEVREKCQASGMNGYLSKPIDVAELNRVLEPFSRTDTSATDRHFEPASASDASTCAS